MLNLLGQLDRDSFRPIFVSYGESPLSDQLLKHGIETVQVPLPPILDVRDGKAFSYSIAGKLRSLRALIAYNSAIERVGRAYRVGGIWGRNAKSILLTGLAARRLGVPLIWDIGLEAESRGLMRLLHWICLHLATVIVTQARSQPARIFGPLRATIFAAKFVPIYPGIDADRGALLRNAGDRGAQADRPFTILSIGTIHPRKNQRMLLQAMRKLVRQYPNLRVLFVGAVGDQAYFSQLKEVTWSEGLEPYAAFLGWRDDIPELLGQSDLFVLCSDNEGVPHAVREAMLAGLPVIATAVGGLPEIIQHGETGFLIPKDAPESLENAIEHCLLNPGVRRSVGENARRFAEQHFSIAAWGAQYNDLLRRLSHKPGVAAP